VAAGTPEDVSLCMESHTGALLRRILAAAPAGSAGVAAAEEGAGEA
jgi:hypothetical protein